MSKNLNLLALMLFSFSGVAFAGPTAVVPAESAVIQVIRTPVATIVAPAPATVAVVSQVATIPSASLVTSFTPASLQQIQTLTQNLISGTGASTIPAATLADLQILLQNVQTALQTQGLAAAGNPDQQSPD